MKEIVRLARNLRRDETAAEKHLWKFLQGRKLDQKKFLRQHPIPLLKEGIKRYFIADFYCAELKLVLELDGGIHEQQKEYDEKRTEDLNQIGIKVVRFSNQEVLRSSETVLKTIQGIMNEEVRA